MKDSKRRLKGIYLVIDPAMELKDLCKKLKSALEGGVNMVQIWNNWPVHLNQNDKIKRIEAIKNVIAAYKVPLLINNEWELILQTGIDGVHFDYLPDNFQQIKTALGSEALFGLTCSNAMKQVHEAIDHDFDYISFCAVFPSPSAVGCDIVAPEIIIESRNITSMPIILSGGIKPENIVDLAVYDFQGIAVISGIMNSLSPKQATENYYNQLNALKQ